MTYLYVIGYLLIAVFLIAIMRVSLKENGEDSPFYSESFHSSYTWAHIYGMAWPLSILVFLVYETLSFLLPCIFTVAECIVIYCRSKITVNKKDDTPTTF